MPNPQIITVRYFAEDNSDVKWMNKKILEAAEVGDLSILETNVEPATCDEIEMAEMVGIIQ